jgi:hypothetical protein
MMMMKHFPLALPAREKFLVLEIVAEGVNGMFLSLDEDRAIVIEKYVRGIDLAKFLGRPWRRATQQAWEGEYLFKDHRRVIAVADSALATTMPIPVTLVRDPSDVKLPLTVAELENLIAQEMAKIFTACRTEAASRLGVHELDTVLVGEKAHAFAIDGNAVADPVGLPGKKVTLFIELTFTGRPLFETLAPFFNGPDEFYFAESAQSRLSALARVRPLPLALIASPSLFVFEPSRGKNFHPILYRESFAWNFDSLFAPFREMFGVSEAVARALYARYREGGFSDHAGRAMMRAFAPTVETLLDEVSQRKLQGSVFFDVPHAAPFSVPQRHGEALLEDLPLDEVLSHVGFYGVKGAASQGIDRQLLSRHLLPLVEAYFDKSNTEINRKLRRRLHWLAS